MLHAFILGAEVECRIGNAVSPGHYARGWHITSTCGVFGAAAAAAKLLRLDTAQTWHALGIAAHQDSDEHAAEKLLDRLREWTAALAIPQNLREFGVTEAHLDALAVAASKVKRLLGNNPKPLSLDDIKAIYRRLLP